MRPTTPSAASLPATHGPRTTIYARFSPTIFARLENGCAYLALFRVVRHLVVAFIPQEELGACQGRAKMRAGVFKDAVVVEGRLGDGAAPRVDRRDVPAAVLRGDCRGLAARAER